MGQSLGRSLTNKQLTFDPKKSKLQYTPLLTLPTLFSLKYLHPDSNSIYSCKSLSQVNTLKKSLHNFWNYRSRITIFADTGFIILYKELRIVFFEKSPQGRKFGVPWVIKFCWVSPVHLDRLTEIQQFTTLIKCQGNTILKLCIDQHIVITDEHGSGKKVLYFPTAGFI